VSRNGVAGTWAAFSALVGLCGAGLGGGGSLCGNYSPRPELSCCGKDPLPRNTLVNLCIKAPLRRGLFLRSSYVPPQRFPGALRQNAVRVHVCGMERKSDSTVHVRLEPELRQRLERLARAEDRPLSSLVRLALRSEADRREQSQGATA